MATILLTHPYRASLFSEANSHKFIAPDMGKINSEDRAAIAKTIPCSKADRVSTLAGIIKTEKVDALIVSSEHDDDVFDDAERLFGLVGPHANAIGIEASLAKTFASKQRTKEFLRSNNVGTIPDVTRNDIGTSSVIVKPDAGWAGDGIEILPRSKALERLGDNNAAQFVFEPCLVGLEVCVVLVSDGTDTLSTPPVYKGTVGGDYVHALKKLRIFPLPLMDSYLCHIEREIRQLISALTFCGTLEVEGIVSASGFRVMEINGRLSGVTRLLAIAGYNVPRALVDIALNVKMSFPCAESAKYACEIPFESDVDIATVRAAIAPEHVAYIFERPGPTSNRHRVLTTFDSLETLTSVVEKLAARQLLPTYAMEHLSAALNSTAPIVLPSG